MEHLLLKQTVSPDCNFERRDYRTDCADISKRVRATLLDMPLLDTTHWRCVCDVTLTIKQAIPSPSGPENCAWFKADEARCRQAFRHFMSLLNRTVYGNAVRRHGKRLRVIPVLEQSRSGRWHYHLAIEPPAHLDAVEFENLIQGCWSQAGWGYRENQVRANADRGWVNYMLKPSQKQGYESWADAIDWEAIHNPVADA